MHTTGGKLTAGSLKQSFEDAGVHPQLIEHLHGAGFFGTLFDAVKKGTKFVLDNHETIGKVGKAAYSAYQSSQKGGKLAGSGIVTAGKLVSKKQTPWTKLVQKIAKQQKCGVREAITYIKENNLYN